MYLLSKNYDAVLPIYYPSSRRERVNLRAYQFNSVQFHYFLILPPRSGYLRIFLTDNMSVRIANKTMVTIQVARDIKAPLEKVWDVVSDIDNEPRYWRGTKSIKNISKNGNVTEREVVIAFKESKCKETVVLEPKKSVKVNISQGPMKGSKTITIKSAGVNKTTVDVLWDIRLAGFMGVFTGMIKKHIKQGTQDALERIATAATD